MRKQNLLKLPTNLKSLINNQPHREHWKPRMHLTDDSWKSRRLFAEFQTLIFVESFRPRSSETCWPSWRWKLLAKEVRCKAAEWKIQCARNGETLSSLFHFFESKREDNWKEKLPWFKCLALRNKYCTFRMLIWNC